MCLVNRHCHNPANIPSVMLFSSLCNRVCSGVWPNWSEHLNYISEGRKAKEVTGKARCKEQAVARMY